jgi:hypothetical protein
MLKPSQKLRVIVNGVSLFTTVRDVRMGIGDFVKINESVQLALKRLETTSLTSKSISLGILGDFAGHVVQLDTRE